MSRPKLELYKEQPLTRHGRSLLVWATHASDNELATVISRLPADTTGLVVTAQQAQTLEALDLPLVVEFDPSTTAAAFKRLVQALPNIVGAVCLMELGKVQGQELTQLRKAIKIIRSAKLVVVGQLQWHANIASASPLLYAYAIALSGGLKIDHLILPPSQDVPPYREIFQATSGGSCLAPITADQLPNAAAQARAVLNQGVNGIWLDADLLSAADPQTLSQELGPAVFGARSKA